MDFTKLTAIQGMKLLKILQDSIIASHTLFFIDEYKSYLDYAKDIQEIEENKVKLIINNGLIATIDDIKIKELNNILGLKLIISLLFFNFLILLLINILFLIFFI